MKNGSFQRFSLRKFKIGTGSILLGTFLMVGMHNEANASELDSTQTAHQTFVEDNNKITTKPNESTNQNDNKTEITESESSASTNDMTESTNKTEEVTTLNTNENTSDVNQPEVTNNTPTSYAENQYPTQETTSKTVETTSDINKDADKDGNLTYFQEQNGYIPQRIQTVQNGVKTGENCTADEVTTSYTNNVDLNAKSIMDTNLDDYSNNGYQEKVKNPNNHPNAVDTENYGPGNLEIQHWQDGPNEATKTQYWRAVFATDYAIDNAEMRVTLPYENVTTTDVSNWVVNRYYPAVSTNGMSKYQHILTPVSVTFNGNVAIINFGNIEANSAYGIMFTKQFDTPQNLSNGLLSTSANVGGTWNEDDLQRQLELKKENMRTQGFTEDEINNAQLDYLKSNLSPKQIEYINEVCEIPDNPNNPNNPSNPDNPENTHNPDNSDNPDNPSNLDNLNNSDNPGNLDYLNNTDRSELMNNSNISNNTKGLATFNNSDLIGNPEKFHNSNYNSISNMVYNSNNHVASKFMYPTLETDVTKKSTDYSDKNQLPNTGQLQDKANPLFGAVAAIFGVIFILFRRKSIRKER